MSNIVYRDRASTARCPGIKRLQQWVDAAVSGAQEAPASLTIRFVDAEEGRSLNHQYRGRDYATNVLSFVAEPIELPEEFQADTLETALETSDEPRYIGDLVVCAPVVEREAKEQGKTRDAHYAHMIVHGVLHLLGYEHEQPDEAEQMEALEIRILAKLGYSNPYSTR